MYLLLGSTGLLGSAILNEANYQHAVLQGHLNSKGRRTDLTNYSEIKEYFEQTIEIKGTVPDVVINCAGDIGGITNNINTSFDKLYNNALIGLNVVKACKEFGVKKLINISSACTYPKTARQPFLEKDVFDGQLEETNQYYSYGKMVTLKAIESCNKQYGTNYYSLMCPNIYGKNDHFDEKGHIIPQLLKKFHDLKKVSEFAVISEVLIQGESDTEREFIFAEDLAKIIVWFAENVDLEHIKAVDDLNLVNVCGYNYTISDVIEIIQNVVGTNFKLKYTGKNTGVSKKQMSDRIFNHIYKGKVNYITLRDGLKEVYEHYVEGL